MNVLVPYVGKGLNEIIDAGADEIYFGFHDSEWTDTFGSHVALNRMTDFGKKANPLSFEEALEDVRRIRDRGRDAFIVLNANGYSRDGVDFIVSKYYPRLLEADATGVIISSLNLAREALDMGMKAVASTMCGVYNRDIARVYHDAGARRFILPRDLSLAEIRDIVEGFPEDEFEVFLMRNGCVFSDGLCLGSHTKECRGAFCSYFRNEPKRYITSPKSFDEWQAIDLNDKLFNEEFHRQTCGLCALYQLKLAGVKALKIVGRSDYWGSIVQDIRLVKEDVRIAERSESEEEYLRKMRFPVNSSRICLGGMGCYYPEVRF